MTRRLPLLPFLLLGCAQLAPLDEEELAPFRACDDAAQCIVAVNAPQTCGARDGDVVAINASQAEAFYDALGGDTEDCPLAPAIEPIRPDPRFFADKYVLGCALDGCAILEVREAAGRACSDTAPCPDDDLCDPGDVYPDFTWCLYVGTSTAT